MSTRAQIQFEGSPVLVYKHSDGYPAGVLPELLAFTGYFWKRRGNDPEYATARYLMYMGYAEEMERQRYSKANPTATWAKEPGVLGWGVDLVVHGDIEYAYYVRKNGDVEVKDPEMSGSRAGFEHDPTHQEIRLMRTIANFKAGSKPSAAKMESL